MLKDPEHFLPTLKSAIRVLRKSAFSNRLPRRAADLDEAVILGTGPSLKKDVPSDIGFFQSRACFCVNDFARTDLFLQLRPKHYILLDPGYYDPDISEALRKNREDVFATINSRCAWPMDVFFPEIGRHSNPAAAFRGSPHITLRYFNTTPLWGNRNVLGWLYRRDLGMPPAYNVLACALFLGVNMGYRKLYLFGADHSWHQEVALAPDNRVCIRQRHFYDEKVDLIPIFKDMPEKETFLMHELFSRWGEVFRWYWEVRKYAESRGARILNGSSNTFIDAFERFTLAPAPAPAETTGGKG